MKCASVLLCVLVMACASNESRPKPFEKKPPVNSAQPVKPPPGNLGKLEVDERAREVVMYALGLLGIGYTFGGKNPEAGLDCSGMISFIYRNALNINLQGNAAQMASLGKEVKRGELKAGDLVFFNTLGRPFSHVGLYIGDDKFIHAPNSRGKVRVDSLSSGYFAGRFEMGRTVLT